MSEPLGKRQRVQAELAASEQSIVKACAADFIRKVSVNPEHKIAHSMNEFNLPSSKRQLVWYYVTTWNAGDAGDALRATIPQAVIESAPVVDDATAGMSEAEKYALAYKYAGNLMRAQHLSERKAAKKASEKFDVSICRATAKAASLRPGQEPPPLGRHQIISKEAEDHLLQIVIWMRSEKLPTYKETVMAHMNKIICGTAAAEHFKHGVTDAWYHNWTLRNADVLKSGNMHFLEKPI